MKLFVAILFTLCALVAANSDFPEYVNVQDLPGSWDGRAIKPARESEVSEVLTSSRITGGEQAASHQFPFQVAIFTSLSDGTQVLCGGSIIGPLTILTAAHCLKGGINSRAIAGAFDRSAAEQSQQHRFFGIENFRIHAGYNSITHANDIATLVHYQPYLFNAYVQEIRLATGFETFAGEIATASGYGRTSDQSTTNSNYLRYVDMPVITNSACSASYSVISASQMCTSTVGGRGICDGDTGGPLFVGTGNSRIQIGVGSLWSIYGCSSGYPAVFTRVSSFSAWISANRS